MDLRCNLEVKARLRDARETRKRIQRYATQRVGVQQQTDTYFHCRQGRLKLREIRGQAAQLIWYQRADVANPKTSRYLLAEITDPETVRAALSGALGVRQTIRKRREIFLYRYVRIHLDQVESLGDFLELEAVLDASGDLDAAERLVADLLERSGVTPEDLLQSSYGDMLAEGQ